jgi:hypothetical protein
VLGELRVMREGIWERNKISWCGDLLCVAVEGVVAGGGRWERISVRRTESDLPAVEMKASVSKASFLRRIEKDINMILLFEICFQNHISFILLDELPRQPNVE